PPPPRVQYPLAYDPGGLLYAHFSPTTERPIMPISVFVDARGVVKGRNFGGMSATDLRNAIRTYLGVT
ncbi:MAG: hypothetical protein ACXVQV_02400, partial [Actinomycetota bacterium]